MPDAPATPGAPDLGVRGLDSFGFDSAADEWLSRLRDAESPLPFGSLGAFERIEEVSRGGQGVVYRAVQPGTRRPTALKRLLGGPMATASMRRRFEREAEVLASLKHPNIVTAFAMDLVDGVPVLAMEWVEGAPITGWAGDLRGPGRVERLARMLLKVCDAVHHAHQRGVIHRDLKPSNILIDAGGEPHVLDFGMAKLVAPDGSGERSMTLTDHFVGTIKYASPEQLTGKPESLDVRTDVYALGVILYEMVSGRLPYAVGDTFTSAARAIEQAEPQPLSHGGAPVDRDFQAIVFKALAKDRGRRYQSVDALASDLRAFLAGEAVTARALSGAGRWLRSLRRHRVAAAFAGTVFFMLAAFAVSATLLAARIADQRDRALAAQHGEAEARRRMERESEKASEVNTFLGRMLAGTDVPHGPDGIDVREMLLAAEPRVAVQLARRPDAQAAARVLVGRAYRGLGLHEQAEAQFKQALALYRDLHGNEHPDVFTTLSELATQWHAGGDNSLAMALGEEMLELYRKLLDEERAPAYADLTAPTALLFRRGDLAGIEKLYRDTLAAHRRKFGEEHLVVADAMMLLGATLADLDKFDEAEAIKRQALDMHRRLVGDDHPLVAEGHHALARTFHAKGDLAAAEAEYRSALAVYRRGFGDEQPEVVEVLFDLGLLLRQAGQIQDEMECFQAALRVSIASLGESHRDVAFCRWRLGQTLLAHGEYAEAALLLRAALNTWEQSLRDGHWRTAQTKSELGACLAALGDDEEAEECLLTGYEVLRSSRGDSHEETVKARDRLDTFYQAGSTTP